MDETLSRTMVPADRAASIAGISRQRLWYWENTGLVKPTRVRRLSPKNLIRFYSLDALLEVVVAAALVNRPGISLQHLRRVLSHLTETGGYNSPLRELRFTVENEEIYFQHPDGSVAGSRRPDQIVFWQVLDLGLLRQNIQGQLRRNPADVGRTQRTRGVMGRKEVFAGTRVPTAVVSDYLQAGYSDTDVLDAFPSLQPGDLAAARKKSAVG